MDEIFFTVVLDGVFCFKFSFSSQKCGLNDSKFDLCGWLVRL